MYTPDVDPEWYLDHVVAASGPDYAPLGPIREAWASWTVTAATLGCGEDPARRRVEQIARRQGLVVTRGQALAAGMTGAELRRLLRRRDWCSPRHGVLCPLPPGPDGAPRGDGPHANAAAAALVRPGSFVGHDSAAAVHDLPLLSPPRRPDVTVDRGGRACSHPDIRQRVAAIDRRDVDQWFGAAVLSVARTVVDLGRSRGTAAALVAADAALHEQIVTRTDLVRALDRQHGWPGVRAARRAIELADPAPESPLESLTRLLIADRDLPMPEPQVWIVACGRRYRVDGLWARFRVVLEADGMAKYRSGFDRVVAEKRRQEFIERAGFTVVRVDWDDVVNHPAQTAARIRSALACGPESPV